MNIFCINLDHRKDRWDFIMKQFLNIPEINIVRFSAIEHKYGRIGCALSHMEVVNKYMNDKEYLIVMEDDCLIKDGINFYNKLIKIILWLKANNNEWDIFNGSPSFVNISTCNILDDKLNIIKYGIGGSATFIIYNTTNPQLWDKIKKYRTELNLYVDNINKGKLKIKSKGKISSSLVLDKYLNNNFICVTVVPYLTSHLTTYSNIEKKCKNYDDIFQKSEKILLDYKYNNSNISYDK